MNPPGERNDPQPLAGMGVLLTRPALQASRTVLALRAAGANVIRFAALEIEALPLSAELEGALAALAGADLAIFVSANAVEFGMPRVRGRGGFAPHSRVAAIGEATRAALATQGVPNVIVAEEGSDSEALLALPDLQRVEGQHIIVFRGRSEGGGRRTLHETLAARGATVTAVETYRRGAPSADPAQAERVLGEFSRGAIDAVHVMSVETLQNLFAMLGDKGAALLRETALVVPHQRIAAAARAMGCARTHVAGLTDAELIGCLATLRSDRPH